MRFSFCKHLHIISASVPVPFLQGLGVLRSLLPASLFDHVLMCHAAHPQTQWTTQHGELRAFRTAVAVQPPRGYTRQNGQFCTLSDEQSQEHLDGNDEQVGQRPETRQDWR